MDFRRVRIQGASYFFTLVTERRRPLLVDHIDCLRDALRQVQAKYPFTIDAIVILPDHLHTIWTLSQDVGPRMIRVVPLDNFMIYKYIIR